MRVAVLHGYDRQLELASKPDPAPGPGQVVLEVLACGVCGSDLFLRTGGFKSTLPIVPGHEAAGRVVALGSDVDPKHGLAVGDVAAIYYIQHCGDCPWCRSGRPNLCSSLVRMGVDVDGAFGTHVTVPAECVIPVSPELDPAVVAVLTDAVGTGYHALTTVGQLRPGERVLVFGIGGIGSNVVQLAAHLGANVTAVSRDPSSLELASALGASEVVRTSPELLGALQEVSAGAGHDLVVQTVGNAEVDRQAVEAVAPGGRVVLVGVTTQSFELRATDLIWREAQIRGSRGFTPQDIRDVVALREAGAITTDHLVTARRPLHEVEQALDDLAAGRVLRTVIEPQRD